MSREILKDIKDFGSKTLDYFKGVKKRAEVIKTISTQPSLKRNLSSDGLELAFSSHPEEENQTFARMKETSEKRKARERKESEAPSNIEMSKPDKKGKSRFNFEFHEQEYTLEGKPDLKEFTEWITKYTKTAESCITCDRLMFPGEPAGACDDGLMHMTRDCCPSGGFYAGHIDCTGMLEPLTDKDYVVIEPSPKVSPIS